MTTQLEQAWELAKQRFAAVGIDVEECYHQKGWVPSLLHFLLRPVLLELEIW